MGISTNTGVVSLRNITKTFPGVVANDNVSLDIRNGQVHCLLGENGAGKSTLISILAGMQQPDSGSIEIDGKVVHIGSPKAAMNYGIGVVYQHSTLVPTLSIIENLMLGESGLLLNVKRATARLEELSGLLGTSIDPHASTGELGLGQQQQVEIAKAMWTGSRLLILDEPTSMLTPQAIDSLAESISRLKAEGLAVVFITHKLREAYMMGDCVTVLRSGKNVGYISPEQMASLSESEVQSTILAAMFGEDLGSTGSLENAADLAGAAESVRETAAIDFSKRPTRLELSNIATVGKTMDVVVSDVTLRIREGEIFGIAGIDGHGQTGLAEVVAGQRTARSGTVSLDGVDVTAIGVRGRQALGLRYATDDRLHEGTVGGLSVALNFMLKRIGEAPFWRWGRTNMHAIDAEAQRLVNEYAIHTPTLATRAGALSGGNIQKIVLARELETGAKVLVANKPTYGLDLKTVQLVHDLLTAFAADGGAVLLISNELDELIELSHRIGVISRGRIVGTVDNDDRKTAERVGQLMIGGGEDGAE
ncbi:putative B6 ABC transporter ATP-binding protein [Rathayibacter soli]|uniref:putative B6 ABC transporter ATP-binding protein n=1 Tax=Rathayibacter soli TaxID=3144168 RepID=UPI0027E5671A|nr:ABC transporter ATP-binding protein [Glaciibacter superstes]